MFQFEPLFFHIDCHTNGQLFRNQWWLLVAKKGQKLAPVKPCVACGIAETSFAIVKVKSKQRRNCNSSVSLKLATLEVSLARTNLLIHLPKVKSRDRIVCKSVRNPTSTYTILAFLGNGNYEMETGAPYAGHQAQQMGIPFMA